MVQSTLSADRLGQVASGPQLQGDSALQSGAHHIGVSGLVVEGVASDQGAMSEGRGSVGEPVPLEGSGEVRPSSAVGVGETGSELGGSNCLLGGAGGGGATAATGGQQPTVLSGHGKRKSRGSEMGEVADNDDNLDISMGSGGVGPPRGDSLGDGGGSGALQRVPSDVGMMIGGAPAARSLDACDSNAAAGCSHGSMPPLLEGPPAVGLVGAGDRPSDADILAWENQILAAETKDQPLVGDREPLEALEAEYAAGSTVFVAKIGKLKESYGSIRRSRGDGNCFYRSFFFGYLEHLISTHDLAERDRMLKQLEGLKQKMLTSGYEELVFESPLDMVLQLLRAVDLPTEPLSVAVLEGDMRSADVSNYILFLLRMLTSSEIKSRAAFFAPFILGMSELDVETFCSRCVDPMGEESDHVQLVALTDALQVPIRVVYLDRSMAPGVGGEDGDVHVDCHDFVPEELQGAEPARRQPRVHLLYRPGHYDIIYPLDCGY